MDAFLAFVLMVAGVAVGVAVGLRLSTDYWAFRSQESRDRARLIRDTNMGPSREEMGALAAFIEWGQRPGDQRTVEQVVLSVDLP